MMHVSFICNGELSTAYRKSRGEEASTYVLVQSNTATQKQNMSYPSIRHQLQRSGLADQEHCRLSSAAPERAGVVEVELMSPTSADVCELRDGKGVVRVLGSSSIVELYYLQSDPGNTSNSGVVAAGAIPLMARDKDMGIWDFKSAIFGGLLKRGNSHGSNHDASLEILLPHEVVREAVPNIGLNLSGQRVSNLEFRLAAVAGVVLQAGAVVFAGAGNY